MIFGHVFFSISVSINEIIEVYASEIIKLFLIETIRLRSICEFNLVRLLTKVVEVCLWAQFDQIYLTLALICDK